MFLLFLFSKVYAFTTVEFDQKLKWQASENVTTENIYFIPKNEQQQYYVNVSLEQQDPEFYLIITLGQQFNPNNKTITTYFDWISQKENRLTRFIRFQPQGQDIYIKTTGKIEQQMNLSIIATNNNMCPNDCNNHGICQIDGCECDPNYVGNDCHQEAQQIYLKKENQVFLISDQLQYLYISVEDQKINGQNISLILQTNNPIQSQLILEKTPILYIPQTQEEQQKIYHLQNLQQNDPQLMSIVINEKSLKPLVLIAKSQGENSIIFISSISDSDQSLLTTTEVIIITCSIVGLLTIVAIILIICFIRRWWLKKQILQKEAPYSLEQKAQNSMPQVNQEIATMERCTVMIYYQQCLQNLEKKSIVEIQKTIILQSQVCQVRGHENAIQNSVFNSNPLCSCECECQYKK